MARLRKLEPQNTQNTQRAAVAYRSRTMRLISRRGLPKLGSRQRCRPVALGNSGTARDEYHRSLWLLSVQRGRFVRRVDQRHIGRLRPHRNVRAWNVVARRRVQPCVARGAGCLRRLFEGCSAQRLEHGEGTADDTIGQRVNPVAIGVHLRAWRVLRFHYLLTAGTSLPIR